MINVCNIEFKDGQIEEVRGYETFNITEGFVVFSLKDGHVFFNSNTILRMTAQEENGRGWPKSRTLGGLHPQTAKSAKS